MSTRSTKITDLFEELRDDETANVVGGIGVSAEGSYKPSTIDYDIALLITSSDIPINGGSIF